MVFWPTSLIAIAIVVTTLLPYVSLPHGIFRAFEFPRLQNVTLAVFTGIFAWLFLEPTLAAYCIVGSMAVATLLHLWHIARFLPIWKRRSQDFKGDRDKASIIRLMVANVKQGNRDYQPLCKLVEKLDPDIAVFMETDDAWAQGLSEVLNDYPERMEKLQDNGYGMILVSKLPLKNEEVRFLLNDEVPSFDASVVHPSGGTFRLFSLHPEPPLVTRDTVGRDAEIARVGRIIRDDDEPVIVCGDLNDVAWSRTTRRFLRISRLLDPREGRGMFNTFDARYFFLRWPLDHIFHSPHFQLVSMSRLPFTGSDHFPMFYELALTSNDIARREVDEADDTDLDEADDLIEKESHRDRRPAATDWED